MNGPNFTVSRNDAFNTVTSIFYFVFLFASSMFYPVDPLPAAFRMAAAANPITWQVDVMRYATIGTVISADRDKLAQTKTNDKTRFRSVDLDEALEAREERRQQMVQIQQALS